MMYKLKSNKKSPVEDGWRNQDRDTSQVTLGLFSDQIQRVDDARKEKSRSEVFRLLLDQLDEKDWKEVIE